MLIYFIHHIATSIQLPHVIAGIARDLSGAIDAEGAHRVPRMPPIEKGPSVSELIDG